MKHEMNITPAGKAINHLRTKSDADPIDMLAQKMSDMMDATKTRLDGIEDSSKKLDSKLDKVEIKMMRGKGGAALVQTWGQQFITGKADDISDLSTRNAGSVAMQVKALDTSATSGGALDVPMRDQTVMLPRQRLPLRAVLDVIGTDSGTIEYANQTTRTNGADVVAEGTAKPESVYEWELQNVSTRVIAHWTKASNQILSDAPQVQGMVDGELRYGLMLKEEQQLLYGTGTGSEINGLVPAATAYDNTAIDGFTAQDRIDDIGVAILQCTLGNYMPTSIVLHPSDWWLIRMLKNGDGEYRMGKPQEVVAPNIFGLPVITTLSMTAGTFLLGDMMSAATLYDRWTPRVELGFVDQDFTNNMVTIRAEQRIAQAIKQSNALVTGTFA